LQENSNMSTKKKPATMRASNQNKRTPKQGTFSGKQPTATAPSAVTEVVRKAPLNPIRIQYREEASDIICQANFENSSFLINPGNEDLFPWLAPIALQFTTFQWNTIKHEFIASTDTSTSGSVIMAVNADPDKPPFTTEKEILNHMGSATAAPWKSFAIDGKSKSTETLGPRKYVADVTGQVGLGSILDDIRTVATGVLNVATLGLAVVGQSLVDPDPKAVGKLFTTYDITLWDPVDQTVSADEGVSRYDSTTGFLFSVPVAWAPDQSVNPLRINAENSTPGGCSFFPSEAGIYSFSVKVAVTSDLGLDQIGSCLLDPAGLDPPTFMWNSAETYLNETGRLLSMDGIFSFPSNTNQSLVSVLLNPTVQALVDPSNSALVITKISTLLDQNLPTMYKNLPKGSRGCTPDCKKSAVTAYLRETARRSRLDNSKSSAFRDLGKLALVNSSKHSKTVVATEVKSSELNCKSALPASSAGAGAKSTPVSQKGFVMVEPYAPSSLAIPAFRRDSTISKSTVLPH